jgi:hypothetical protein
LRFDTRININDTDYTNWRATNKHDGLRDGHAPPGRILQDNRPVVVIATVQKTARTLITKYPQVETTQHSYRMVACRKTIAVWVMAVAETYLAYNPFNTNLLTLHYHNF